VSEGRPRLRAGLSAWLAAAARHPLATFALLVALQTGPSLFARGVWANDEVRHADALRGVLSGKHAVVLHLAGKPYPDKPPLWFWLVAGIERATRLPVPAAFFVASAIGAFLFAASAWALARAARAPPATALVAGLVALATPITAALAQNTRMDLAFSALIVASQTAALVGLAAPRFSRWTVVAGALALLALGVKGPLGIALPLASSVAWAWWTHRLRRLLAWDVLAACLVVLAGVGAYAALAIRAEGAGFLETLVREQFWRRASSAGSHAGPPWTYVAMLPLLLVPWTATLVGLPWRRVREAWTAARLRRREQRWADAIGVTAVSGFVVLSVVSAKNPVYVLPLVPPIAVLVVRALERMEERARVRTFAAMGVCAVALAVAVPFADRVHPWPLSVHGLLPMAGALLLAALASLLVRRRPALEAASVSALGVLLVAGLALGLVAPSLEPVMSPEAQALDLRARADAGYAPLVYRTYPGIYAWHAGRAIPETGDPAVLAKHLASSARAVVSMPQRYAEQQRATLAGMRVVAERWIAGVDPGRDVHVLLVKDDAAGGGDR
jgi:4-amino-4-deoxy-L-arabinose transferase-like glycosyltransferase